jgi:hypothetical protein
MTLVTKLIVVFAFLSIFTFAVWAIMIERLEAQRERSNRCYVHFYDGAPHSLLIDSSQYTFQPDGTLDKRTNAFMNPYHREMWMSGKCIRVDM